MDTSQASACFLSSAPYKDVLLSEGTPAASAHGIRCAGTNTETDPFSYHWNHGFSDSVSNNANVIDSSDIHLLAYCTGFGSFHQVKNNPSSTIVEYLKDAEHIDSNIHLCAGEEIEVSTVGADEAVSRIHKYMVNMPIKQIIQKLNADYRFADDCKLNHNADLHRNDFNKNCSNNDTSHTNNNINSNANELTKSHGKCNSNGVTCINGKYVYKIIIHIGVDVNAPKFHLEMKAFNEASFNAPDVRGYQPVSARITEGEERYLSTTLSLPAVAVKMRNLGIDCEVSTNPGRFICNYIYFRSLQESINSSKIPSLFVHVPPLEVIPLEKQLSFVRSLLRILRCEMCKG